jgi:hypothetical protein
MGNHARNRYATKILLKKLKFSPVVLIQGPRQTGKSYLVKNLLLSSGIQVEYKTFDIVSLKRFATKNPDSFVRERNENTTLTIDEAQKVPDIFDSIKAVVDEQRKPGQFILLGSTEFSRLTNVRESLTGRASKVRVFPFTLSEVKHLPLNSNNFFVQNKSRVDRNELLRFLKNGGMPGIFGIKDQNEKQQALKDWLDLTSERDALIFSKLRIESDLISRILQGISTLDDTSAGALSKYLRVDLRKIKNHIQVLLTLFVINKIDPHPTSTGKTQYFICDVGFLEYYGSSFEKKLKTFVFQEFMAQKSYRGEDNIQLNFYRTAKGKIIDYIFSEGEKIIFCFKVLDSEEFDSKQFDILRFFKLKHPDYFTNKTRVLALTGTLNRIVDKGVEIYPWESIV